MNLRKDHYRFVYSTTNITKNYTHVSRVLGGGEIGMNSVFSFPATFGYVIYIESEEIRECRSSLPILTGANLFHVLQRL